MIYHRHWKLAFRWRSRSAKLTQPIYGTRGEENRSACRAARALATRESARASLPASAGIVPPLCPPSRERSSTRIPSPGKRRAIPRASALFRPCLFRFSSPPPLSRPRMNPRAARARRPEAAPIKLDGDVRAAAVSRDAEARRSSSRLAGPFSRSLSAVMECINIGEPAGPPTDAPCTLRARPFASNNRGGRCRDTSRGMEYSYKPPLRCKPPGPAH